MRPLFKTLHLICLSVFLGSIATYIFMGAIISPSEIEKLRMSREFVALGTRYLTLPALFATGFTGVLLSGRPKTRWLWSKVIIFILIAINTLNFIYPAIEASLQHLDGETNGFDAAMGQEAFFGGINLVLIFSLIAIAVIKPRFKKKQARTSAIAPT